MMTADKKLAFLHKMAKLGLDSIPHYDAGGTVQASGTTLTGPASGVTSGGAPNPNTGVMGNIAGALGLNNNYQAGGANIQQGTNSAQLNQAYTGAQAGLAHQGDLVTQTQPGIAQGINTQNVLSGQLAGEAAGVGPNPAQAALNQSTGQNINEQAALAAGQRGAGANAGMIAENAARTGANVQQQAIGQAATLQAQQQIAAQQAEQQLSATQIGEGVGAVQGDNQQQQNEQNILQGANTAGNNASVGMQSNINNVNSQVAAGNAAAASNVVGGVLSGASAAISHLFAEGGEVKKMAEGGYMAPAPLVVNPAPAGGPQSFVGQWLNSNVSNPGAPSIQQTGPMAEQSGFNDQAGDLGSSIGNAMKSNAPWDPNRGSISSGEKFAGGADASSMPDIMAAAKGGAVRRMLPPMHGKNAALIAKGGKVKADGKGEKAVKNTDSYANDKVPALLSEGEVVMDKDTLNDPGPIGNMARTVAHHISMRNKGAKRA